MQRFCLLLTMFGIVWVQTASAGLTNRYVIKNNAGAAVPYDTPANAAGDIQTAINYANPSETVLVYAATYDAGGTNNWPADGKLTNRVAITKAITVRSLNNDPTNTIIKGAWDPVTTNGWLAIRCVYMVSGSSLVGFTITNGATITSNEMDRSTVGHNACGGGICTPNASSATISNCIIVNNRSFGDAYNGQGGGGVCNGTFFNTIIKDNSTPFRGGGAFAGWSLILSNCTLSGNSAIGRGGGVASGLAPGATLYGCVLSSNLSSAEGGGSFGGTLHGCTVSTNSAANGGGASGAILSNCTVAFNYAGVNGAGVDGGTVYNSTIVSNYASGHSGAANGSAIFNSVLSYNRTASANYTAGWVLKLNNCIISYHNGGNMALGNPVATNCLIYGNSGWKGGAVYGGFRLYNCTVVGNRAWNGGGVGIESAGVTSYVINCIVYSNFASVSDPEWYAPVGSAIVFTNSCTWPTTAVGWAAGNNTTNNPLFMANGSGSGSNLVPGNYRLQANSPCMNSGLNQSWMDTAVDRDGHSRIDRFSGMVDMGCYEYLPRGMMFKVR